MKTSFQRVMLALSMALGVLSSSVAYAGNDVPDREKKGGMKVSPLRVKPVTGTWINLAYKDVRNKYTNPQNIDNTDPELWKAKVRELSAMGMEYLVFMEVANEGKAYYPSGLMPWWYDKDRQSPVEAILEEAARYDMKVFMSTGWARNQDDNLQEPAIKQRQLQIMEELAALYKEHKAFYGWYLPVEDCICPLFAEHAVQSVNTLVEKAQMLTPGKKTLISPYGIGLSDFDNPDFEKQMAKLKVDIIAYQDEVGCVRERFPLPRLKKNWQRLRDIHDRLNIEMWANCETFTWEQGTNDRTSALIPAAYPRLLSQQVAASIAGVDRIISFMFCGIIENGESTYQLGQPIWSNKVCGDYMDWKNGAEYWRLAEAAFMGRLGSKTVAKMVSEEPSLKALLDGRFAEEDSNDTRWVKFEKGHHEFIVDLQKKNRLQRVMLRMLDYRPDGIGMPLKVCLFTSLDGKTYRQISVKDASLFPNNKHDAWIESIMFDRLDEYIRYVKISFEAPQQVYIDEFLVNPIIK